LQRPAWYWLPWTTLALVSLVLAADLATWTWRDTQQGIPVAGVAINFVLRLLPMLLLLLALALLIEVVEEEAQRGRMTPRVRRLLYWGPRVAVLLFAAFLSLFALDVFGMGYSPWETIVAFLLHLTPVFLLIVGIAIAWRWEWVGALVLTGWAVVYVVTARGFPLSVYVYLAGLPFVLGLLFLLNWRYRREVRGWNAPGPYDRRLPEG
jgi:hypothetical protein